MSNYILLIAWSVAGCSLAGGLLMYWRYRRMVRYYNKAGLLRMLPVA